MRLVRWIIFFLAMSLGPFMSLRFNEAKIEYFEPEVISTASNGYQCYIKVFEPQANEPTYIIGKKISSAKALHYSVLDDYATAWTCYWILSWIVGLVVTALYVTKVLDEES